MHTSTMTDRTPQDHVDDDVREFEQWLDEQMSPGSAVMRYYASPEFAARMRAADAWTEPGQSSSLRAA